jgi:hypothetical protein
MLQSLSVRLITMSSTRSVFYICSVVLAEPLRLHANNAYITECPRCLPQSTSRYNHSFSVSNECPRCPTYSRNVLCPPPSTSSTLPVRMLLSDYNSPYKSTRCAITTETPVVYPSQSVFLSRIKIQIQNSNFKISGSAPRCAMTPSSSLFSGISDLP